MKPLIKYIPIYAITAASLILLLIAVACIPREMIAPKIEESAECLTEQPFHFVWILPGVEGSRLDQYADSMLLSVTYYLDEKAPLQSLMWSRYYWDQNEYINASFLKGVREHAEPNQEYLRYWHGSQIFVRPMLLFWNVRQIYIFHSFLLALLVAWLLFILIKGGMKREAFSLCVALIAVNIWFVPLCLEYFWMFEVMLIASIIVVKTELGGKRRIPDGFFLVIGIVTVFLDFFTTETLTLLIPMLLLLRIRSAKNQEQGAFYTVIKCSWLWGFGYVTMWCGKWLLASIVLRQNVMPYVQNSIAEHMGQFDTIPASRQLMETLMRNVGALFPFGYGICGAVFFVVLLIVFLFIPVLRGQIVLKPVIPKQRIRIYLFIGAVPYIRYLLIRHHSWFHYYFMHRAQAASIMALCLILFELL